MNEIVIKVMEEWGKMPDEDNYQLHVLRIAFRANATYGIDT